MGKRTQMRGNLVTMASFPDLTTAQFFQSLLEENGISAFLPEENILFQDPRLIAGFGGVRLQVPERDAERASKILQEMEDRYDAKPMEKRDCTATPRSVISGDQTTPYARFSLFLLGAPLFGLYRAMAALYGKLSRHDVAQPQSRKK
jgi:hypothetical protein